MTTSNQIELYKLYKPKFTRVRLGQIRLKDGDCEFVVLPLRGLWTILMPFYEKKLPQPTNFSFCFLVSGFSSPVQHTALLFGLQNPTASYGHTIVSNDKYSWLRREDARSTCNNVIIIGVPMGWDIYKETLWLYWIRMWDNSFSDMSNQLLATEQVKPQCSIIFNNQCIMTTNRRI